MILVVDVDGTLSDDRWRRDLAEQKRWDEYHQQQMLDEPVKPLVEIIEILSNHIETVGLTGRPEKYRQPTLTWMLQHNVLLDELLMRPDNDYTAAPKLKLKLLTEFLIGRTDDLVVIVDDRDDITQLLRSHGFYVLQAGL